MHLIVGGSGTLGSLLVKRLLAAGEPVRVMTRNPDKLAGHDRVVLEVVRGDILDPASLAAAASGGVLTGSGPAADVRPRRRHDGATILLRHDPRPCGCSAGRGP